MRREWSEDEIKGIVKGESRRVGCLEEVSQIMVVVGSMIILGILITALELIQPGVIGDVIKIIFQWR